MPVASKVEAFTAFEKQLRMLCLDEFPCGTGSWRNSNQFNDVSSKFAVSLKDGDASKEPEEVLEELVTSKFSPYSVDYSWSKEAKELREIAVKSPWLISKEFILNHFETLRIVDKNVSNVDAGILQFKNLQELTLSANRIKNVDGCNLPRSLKVLELVANDISDLEPLCNHPPQLHHLGLGLNHISAVHDYLTKSHWPTLLSLDLSYNNLSDLKDLVQKLQTLPKLRNLALIGNPLAFIPGYRGFVIDSLRSLTILDDSQISADEKHHFKGLARRKDFVKDEVRIKVKIQALTGVPKPPEIDPPEELPEFPIIKRTYYVEFLFLEDFASKVKDSADAGDKQRQDEKEVDEDVQKDQEKVLENGLEDLEDAKGVEMNSTHAGEDATEANIVPVGTFFTALESQTPSAVPPLEPDEGTPTPSAVELKLVSYRTQALPWSEENSVQLDLDFNQELIIDDLPALKEFLRLGLQIFVKEDKVSCFPAEESSDDRASQTSAKKGGKEKDGGKSEKKEKEKPKEAKGDKGKKKKKEPELELVHSPPEVTVLGSYHLSLADFVDGENVAQEVCTCIKTSAGEDEAKEEPAEKNDTKKDKKKKAGEAESPKTKKGKEAKDKEKDKGKKGTKPEKKDSKGKRPSSGKSVADEEEEEEVPPPPLTVAIRVELVKWNTAQDSIPKSETENNKIVN